METYQDTCFFIMTCNHVEKVLDAIRSRCIEYEFRKPDKIQIGNLLGNICRKEGIDFDPKGLSELIHAYYPSIRDMVQQLQKIKAADTKLTKEEIQARNNEFEQAWKLIQSGKFFDLRKQILIEGLNAHEFNKWMFTHIIFRRNEIGIAKMKKIIQLLAQNERDFAFGVDINIVFLASILRVIEILSS